MKDLGSVQSKANGQTYKVAADIDEFGPLQVVAWRCGAKPIEFKFIAEGFSDPLLSDLNTHVLLAVYGNPDKMPEPTDFVDALVLPL